MIRAEAVLWRSRSLSRIRPRKNNSSLRGAPTTRVSTEVNMDKKPFSLRKGSRAALSSFARSTIVSASTIRMSSHTVRAAKAVLRRSEEHTSELQSRPHLVCRLLLEKKKKKKTYKL